MKLNFSLLRKKTILLLCHEHADLDSFCSAAIMQYFLKRNKVSSTLAVPSHINEQALRFAEENKISFISNPSLELFDEVFLFDFNGYEQLGSLRSRFIEINNSASFNLTVFDHHVLESTSISKNTQTVIRDCLSTTEVLFRLFGKSFSSEECFFTCIGILEDTGRFLVGSEKSFAVFSEALSRSKRTYADALSFAKHQLPFAEKMAFLRAAQRARIVSIKSKMRPVLVVLSELSFFQAPAATMLLDFGADISLVAGTEKNGVTTLSARADSAFKERQKFNLVNDLLKPLQKQIGGEIGGHSGAAQWKGSVASQRVLEYCLIILREYLV